MEKLIATLDKHFNKREEKTYSSNKLIHNLKDYYVNLARLKGEALELRNKFYEIDSIFENYIPYVRHLDKYDFLFLLNLSHPDLDEIFNGPSGIRVTETLNGWDLRVSINDYGVDIRFKNDVEPLNPKELLYSDGKKEQSSLTPITYSDKIECMDSPINFFTITEKDFNDLYLLSLKMIKKIRHIKGNIEDIVVESVDKWVESLEMDGLAQYFD